MSVVWLLAARNAAGSLAATIASVQAQSCRDWQLVVVDDGSTDATPQVIARAVAEDPRIHALRNAAPAGLAAALNRAWQSFPAAYYARIDADDTCLPDRLEQQLEFLEAHPEISVVGGGAVLVNDRDEQVGELLRCQEHAEMMRRLLLENPFIHPTVTIRREFLLRTGGYDESLPRSQDFDLWLRGCREFRYANLPRPLIRYRVRTCPSWSTTYWGTRTIWRAARQQRLGLWGCWYPARFFIATTLMRWRLWRNPLLRMPEGG